jgi:hypothetical protein
MNTETMMSVLVGIGLSAACGFRVFVPLLVMSVASLSGHLNLSSGFEWIGTYPAVLAFAVATVLEIAGYYIPWVDHLLDIIASPAAVIAGIIAMASTLTGMSPFLRWSFAIIAGGGVAGIVQAHTGLARLTSTATTGGLGNPVVSTVEAGGSIALSVLALAIPLAAAALIVAILALIFWPGRKLLRRLRSQKGEGGNSKSTSGQPG